MAEEANNDPQEKTKPPIMWILIGVLGSVLLSVGIVMATLYFTGFFSDESDLQQEIARLEAEEQAAAEAETAANTPELMETPDPSRLDTLYYQMSSPLTANIQSSRKVMQVTVTVMTHYDQMVIDRVTKHEPMIRASMLEVMGNITEDNLAAPTFKQWLADNLKLAANAVLEEQEDFGGIERVLFVEYLVQ
jgi:flagellar FliL protein